MTGPADGRNEALLSWYAVHRRDLPWRRTRNPWAILVSEVMLQQTQVDRVVPAYRRFLDRFPDPGTLADAPLAEVISTWGDLGYQRRAVNLRAAAAAIAADGWPTDPTGLSTLPGVGPYTAAAVAAFAFGCRVPAVDTNLARVLSRWVGRPLAGAGLAAQAAADLDESPAADWNQAVMDLASAVCARRSPRCDDCPVSRWCADPTVSVRRPRQTPYAGSVRQARAAVMKRLARVSTEPLETLAGAVALEPETVDRAVTSLAAEGLVEIDAGTVSLAR